MSLAAYIAEDLSAYDGYAPHGMEATVTNLRNRAAKKNGTGPTASRSNAMTSEWDQTNLSLGP